ncbi:MAG: glycosyltransferase [bacterium]
MLRWRLLATAALYRAIWRLGGWWPLVWFGGAARPRGAPRLAYYHHAFPILSETFIQREVRALRQAGLAVEVLSHEVHSPELFDAEARALRDSTVYLPWLQARDTPPRLWALARRHPLRLANAFAYLLCQRHGPRKAWRHDRRLFNRAVLLAGELRARRITHVHSPWASPDATVAMVAARLADARYTVQARASDIHRHSAVFGRSERLRNAAFVITNTRYNEALLAPLLRGRGGPPLHVIRNGIDLRRFTPPARPRRAGEPLRVLCVGRLTEPKGTDDLLRACAVLREAGLRVTCEIVGGRVGNEVNHYLTLKKLHRRLDLADSVQFAGAQPFDRVLARYAQADVFVLPAVHAADGRREVTPNALIEAMAMQCAVISTPVGGIPEIVEDGVSGLLVASHDALALAAALARLHGDAELREQLGRAARRRVEERFDMVRNIAAYVALFGGVAAGPAELSGVREPLTPPPASGASETT